MKKLKKAARIILGLCLTACLLPETMVPAAAEETVGSVSYSVEWSDSDILLTVTPANAGTAYYLVQEADAAVPSKDSVISNARQECAGGAATQITISGFSSDTAKNVYVVYQDASSQTTYDMTALTLPAASDTSSEAAAYKIDVGAYYPDFGTAQTGYTAPAEHTVTFTNNGTASMTLSIASGADNYTASLSSSELAAGAAATLTVQPKSGLSNGNYDTVIKLNAAKSDGTVVLTPEVSFRFTVAEETETSSGTITYGAKWTDTSHMQLSVTADIAGKAYYIVQEAGTTAPTAGTVQSSGSTITCIANVESSVSLAADSTQSWDIYIVYEDENERTYNMSTMTLPAGEGAAAEGSPAGSVSFEGERSGDSDLSLTITPTVTGTLYYIVKDSADSAPSESDYSTAASISVNSTSSTTATISLGSNPANAKNIYLRYVSSDNTAMGTTVLEVPAASASSFSAEISPTEIDLGNPLEDYTAGSVYGTAVITNTGAGTVSFEVNTSDENYSTFSQYFTVDTSAAQNIASGSSGTVVVKAKTGLSAGTYSSTFTLVDQLDSESSLSLGPATVTVTVAEKGDSTVEGVRDPEGSYTPGNQYIPNGLLGDSLYSLFIDGKVAYSANYNYTLYSGSSWYEDKYGLIPDVTNKELDTYTGFPNPYYTSGRVYPPNKYGYTPVKVGSDTSKVRDQVAKVLYYGYPNDALGLRTSGDRLANDNNYNYVLINQGRKDYAFMIATQCAIWHYTDGIDFSDIASASNNDSRATHIKDIYTVVPIWGWEDVQNLYNLLVENPAEILSTTYTGSILHGSFKNGYYLGMELADPPESFAVDLYVADNPITINNMPSWSQNLVAGRMKSGETESVSISITKVWSDNSDSEGYRPSADDFKSWLLLYRGTEQVTGYEPTVTDNGNNTYTITYSNLPASSSGYTIQENIPTDLQSYYKVYANASASDGGLITNTGVTQVEKNSYLTIHKIDNNGLILTGAVFALYEDTTWTDPIATLTAVDGTLVIRTSASYLEDYLPSENGGEKTIYLKEITAPAGYAITGTAYPITLGTVIEEGWNTDGTAYTVRTSYTISSNGNASLDIRNVPDTQTVVNNNSLTVNKVNSSGETLPDAVFTLYSDEDCTHAITTYTTDSTGTLTISTSDTALADYIPAAGETSTLYLKETTAPENYSLVNTVYPITLSTTVTEGWIDSVYTQTTTQEIYYESDNVKHSVIRVVNTTGSETVKHSDFALYKTGVDGAALDGAVFTLYSDADCTTSLTTVTTSSGAAFINTSASYLGSSLPAAGSTVNLYLKETTAPTGYTLSSEVYTLVLGCESNGTEKSYTLTYDNSSSLTVSNAPKTRSDTSDGALQVFKVDEDEQPLAGAVFALYEDTAGSNLVKTFDATDSTGTLTISTADSYLENYIPDVGATKTVYLMEKTAPDNYKKSTTVYALTLRTYQESAWDTSTHEYVTTTYHTITHGANSSLTVVNEAVIDLSFTKKWEDNAIGDAVEIQLTRNGADYGDPVTITSGMSWVYTFKDLPKYDSNGDEYVYSVRELTAGYQPVVSYGSDGSIVLTNYPSRELTKLQVTKEWNDGASGRQVVIELLRNNEETGMVIILTDYNNWIGVFDNLPIYNDAGQEISWSVQEVADNYDDTVSDVTYDETDSMYKVTVANSPSSETVDIPVEKKWADGVTGDSAEIVLLRDGGSTGQRITLNEGNQWKGTFQDLPKYASDGHEYEYTVGEETSEWTYTVTSDGNGGFIVTNYKTPDTPDKPKNPGPRNVVPRTSAERVE